MKPVILSLMFVAALAANTQAQSSFGPEAGLLFSNYNGKLDGQTTPQNKAKAGFTAGLVENIGLNNKNLFLQPGLIYMMNGFKYNDPIQTGGMTVNTFEIPFNFLYKFGDAGVDNFFIGAGPYIALNLSGKATTSGNFGSGSASEKLTIGNDPTDDLRPVDYGIGISLGYGLLRNFFLCAHYQFGLANLIPQGDAQNTIKNSNYGLSFGYLFADKHQHTRAAKSKSKPSNGK